MKRFFIFPCGEKNMLYNKVNNFRSLQRILRRSFPRGEFSGESFFRGGNFPSIETFQVAAELPAHMNDLLEFIKSSIVNSIFQIK